MRKKFLMAFLAAGMFGGLIVPNILRADSVTLNVDLGADDEAHFHFADPHRHHKPEILKAAQKLQEAKHNLWKAKNDFGGHKANAIMAINTALDELRMAEDMK